MYHNIADEYYYQGDGKNAAQIVALIPMWQYLYVFLVKLCIEFSVAQNEYRHGKVKKFPQAGF